MLKRIVLFLLAAVLLLCTMGCAGKNAGSEDAMEFVKGIKVRLGMWWSFRRWRRRRKERRVRVKIRIRIQKVWGE